MTYYEFQLLLYDNYSHIKRTIRDTTNLKQLTGVTEWIDFIFKHNLKTSYQSVVGCKKRKRCYENTQRKYTELLKLVSERATNLKIE